MEPVLLPRKACALALDKLNVRAGVVVAVATDAVKIGERLPEENDVTVPVPNPVIVEPALALIVPPLWMFSVAPLGTLVVPGKVCVCAIAQLGTKNRIASSFLMGLSIDRRHTIARC